VEKSGKQKEIENLLKVKGFEEKLNSKDVTFFSPHGASSASIKFAINVS